MARPTKYGKHCEKKVKKVTEKMTTENFLECCSVDHLAFLLGVHRDTVYEWRKIHPEFSDTLKKWETKRNALFFSLSHHLPVAMWIFLSKNWLGFSDRPGENRDEAAPTIVFTDIFQKKKEEGK